MHKPSILEHNSVKIAEFMKAQPVKVSTEWVKDLPSLHYKYNLLAHLYNGDQALEAYLCEKSEELVFNYKNKHAKVDLHYFLKFYQTLSEKSFA